MKNALKKILASAMALTLLGTGTTAISPNSHHTFIAHAGYNHEYEHNCYSYQCSSPCGSWDKVGEKIEKHSRHIKIRQRTA